MKFPKLSHLLAAGTHEEYNLEYCLIHRGRIQALNRNCGVYLSVNDFVPENQRSHVNNKIFDKGLLEQIESADTVEFKVDGVLIKHGDAGTLDGLTTIKVPYSGVLHDTGEILTFDEMLDEYTERSTIKIAPIHSLLSHVLLENGDIDAKKWRERRTTYFKSLMLSYTSLRDIVETLVFDLDDFGNVNIDMFGDPKYKGSTADAPTQPLIISAACTELTKDSSIIFMMPSFSKPKKK